MLRLRLFAGVGQPCLLRYRGHHGLCSDRLLACGQLPSQVHCYALTKLVGFCAFVISVSLLQRLPSARPACPLLQQTFFAVLADQLLTLDVARVHKRMTEAGRPMAVSAPNWRSVRSRPAASSRVV